MSGAPCTAKSKSSLLSLTETTKNTKIVDATNEHQVSKDQLACLPQATVPLLEDKFRRQVLEELPQH